MRLAKKKPHPGGFSWDTLAVKFTKGELSTRSHPKCFISHLSTVNLSGKILGPHVLPQVGKNSTHVHKKNPNSYKKTFFIFVGYRFSFLFPPLLNNFQVCQVSCLVLLRSVPSSSPPSFHHVFSNAPIVF